MLAFTVGNLLAAFATHLTPLLAARLLSGLAHGVFFAVASSVATRLVPPKRAGAALALVFGGVTVAMALGVPAGTWLGSVLPWQWIFALIAGCGLIGSLGLAWWMPSGAGDLNTTGAGWRQLPVLFDRRLLAGASLPLLSYTGSFALYTFITPLLLQVTHTDIRGASVMLLAYGIGAAVGNVVGGRMTDRLGMDRASLWLLAGNDRLRPAEFSCDGGASHGARADNLRRHPAPAVAHSGIGSAAPATGAGRCLGPEHRCFQRRRGHGLDAGRDGTGALGAAKPGLGWAGRCGISRACVVVAAGLASHAVRDISSIRMSAPVPLHS
jgi:MFS family permease